MSAPLKPIESATVKQTFFEYLDCIDIPEIDYFAIGIQNVQNHQSMTLMSRPEWQSHFIKNGFAEADPVRNAVLHSKKNIILIPEIDAQGSLGAEIMRHRSLHGVKNGVILITRTPALNYMLTLGTAYSKFDASRFIRAAYPALRALQKDLEKIIEPEARKFIHPQG
jgi:hypothetical protein